MGKCIESTWPIQNSIVKRKEKFSMSKMFMNVKEVMEVLEVSESYAYKLMKRLNRELQAMGCQTIAGKVDRKYFYEQFYGTRSNDGRN